MEAALGPMRTACHECDLLVTVAEVGPGEVARCPRCQHVLTVGTEDGLTRSLAFALAAAVLLVLSNCFPFLSLQASGLEQVMSLPQSARQLYDDGYWTIAVFVMGPIVVIPGLMLAIVSALLIPLREERYVPWLVPAGRILFAMNPWSMVEVFVVGVLVSLVKIGAMATVVLGISFWSYVGFALCFIATFTHLDRMQMWRRIAELRRRAEEGADPGAARASDFQERGSIGGVAT